MKLTVRRDPEEYEAIEYLDSTLGEETRKLPGIGMGPYVELEDGSTGQLMQKWRTAGGQRRREEGEETQYHRPMFELCGDTAARVYEDLNGAEHVTGSDLKVGHYTKSCGPCLNLAYSSRRCPEHGAEAWDLPASVRAEREPGGILDQILSAIPVERRRVVTPYRRALCTRRLAIARPVTATFPYADVDPMAPTYDTVDIRFYSDGTYEVLGSIPADPLQVDAMNLAAKRERDRLMAQPSLGLSRILGS